MPNHPMKTRLEGLTKNLSKRSSFVYKSKKLTYQFQEWLHQNTLPLFLLDMPQPWVMDITDNQV